MARFGITYDEVVQIAEALLQHGISPTMQRVREKLGNTGSFATLSKYLNAWRSERLLATTSENLVNPVPPVAQWLKSGSKSIAKPKTK